MAECVFCRKLVLQNGKLLQCLHSACAKCLRTVPRAGRERKAIACSLCSQQTALPSQNPDDVLHLPDDLISAAASLCAECDSARVTHKCVTCCELYCESHGTLHPNLSATLDHDMHSIERHEDDVFEESGSGSSGDDRRLPLCLHHAFPVEDCHTRTDSRRGASGRSSSSSASEATYCITCDEVLCPSCRLESTHEGSGGGGEHELVTLAQAAHQQRGELSRLLPDVTRDLLPRLKIGESLVSKELRQFDSSIGDVRADIEETAQKLINRVQLERNHLLRQLDAFHAEKRTILKTQLDSITSAMEKTQRAGHLGSSLMRRSDGARFVHDASWVLDCLYEITSKMPSVDSTISDDTPTASSSKERESYEESAAALAANVAGMNPFDDPPNNGSCAAMTTAGEASLTSAFSVATDQLALEPACNPRISFVDYSLKPMEEPTLVGVLSLANIDHSKCSLRPLQPPLVGAMHGTGDLIAYLVTVVSADGSVVAGADEVGLEVKAVLVTADTVTDVPCTLVADTDTAGQFRVTFRTSSAAEILLYASIDQCQLPGSPAQISIGRYPLEFDASKASGNVRVRRRGYRVTMETSADSVILGKRVLRSGTHRWRVMLSGLQGSDYIVVGVCRAPIPTNFSLSISSYAGFLGWTSRSQTLVKGAFRTVAMPVWQDGDVIELQVDYGKHCLSLLHCRTGVKSVMSGAAKAELVPFFYMFSRSHSIDMVPLPSD
eukprot:scpid20489/ scgid20058/ 